MLTKKQKYIRGGMTLGILIMLSVSFYFLFTPQGSEQAVRQMLNHQIGHDELLIGETQGNLIEGLTFSHLELTGLEAFPEGSVLKIQKLFLRSASLNPADFIVEVENVRLLLPNADPIVLTGQYRQGQMNFNLYSKSFSVRDVLEYFSEYTVLREIFGFVSGVDLLITGPLNAPVIKGEFSIETLTYHKITLTEAPIAISFDVKPHEEALNIQGEIQISGGRVQTNKTVINLEKSLISLNDDLDNPSFHIKGRCVIDQVKIAIALDGTYHNLELMLTSEPSLTREHLMLMLATGKRWKGAEQTLEKAKLSPDLAKDFIDYFFFTGKGEGFAKRFGLHDVSVTYRQNERGLSGKKSVTNNIDLGYAIQKKVGETGETAVTTQTVSGEVKMTEHISVDLEKELGPTQDAGASGQPSSHEGGEQKIFLKYKKSF